jgi:succinate-acetate transporter protein
MNIPREKSSGDFSRAASPAESGARQRAGRASGQRRYRNSDGQTIIGYTSNIIGSLSLGAVLLDYLRGSEIVPMFLVSSIGLIVATAWCAYDRKFQTATIFGSLAGFNLSYALLQLGVSNGWYSIPIQDLSNVLTFYSIAWIAIFTLLSLVALNSSVAAFLLFLAVDVSLGLVAAANMTGSIDLLRWSAAPVAVIIAISVGFIGHVMWGWHRRNLIEAARAQASKAPAVANRVPAYAVADRIQDEPAISVE